MASKRREEIFSSGCMVINPHKEHICRNIPDRIKKPNMSSCKVKNQEKILNRGRDFHFSYRTLLCIRISYRQRSRPW